MAAPIQKPQIPVRRGPIPVSEEARSKARAGMSGEQVKSAVEASPASAEAPVAAPEPPAAPSPEAVALPEPSPVVAAPTETLNAPAAAPAPASVPATAAARSVAPGAAPVAGRRGRKPAPPEAVLMEPEHSVKIPESVWNEIRLALVLLPKGEDSPASIKAYLVAAHRTYEAQLRKQGKLPAAK